MTPNPGFVVFRQLADGTWELVGEAERQPGLTAKRARQKAVVDATGCEVRAGEVYAAVLRSEWRVSLDI